MNALFSHSYDGMKTSGSFHYDVQNLIVEKHHSPFPYHSKVHLDFGDDYKWCKIVPCAPHKNAPKTFDECVYFRHILVCNRLLERCRYVGS